MKTRKRLIAPATMLFGSMVAAVAFAMPASAADPVYPPPGGTEVLGTSASTSASTTAAAPATTAASGELAFTGGTMVGIGALGGLLLVGGTTMVVASKRRKVDA